MSFSLENDEKAIENVEKNLVEERYYHKKTFQIFK